MTDLTLTSKTMKVVIKKGSELISTHKSQSLGMAKLRKIGHIRSTYDLQTAKLDCNGILATTYQGYTLSIA